MGGKDITPYVVLDEREDIFVDFEIDVCGKSKHCQGNMTKK